ncbi:putative entry exclusion protein TrbK-alt [Brucella intermedia]|uniref:putative entry exclusion protein TrbK-alt n=1 Tax=Brucella intermedia TaxID=94625 RepID=UPI00224B22E5|nr:putative entry exclusion protein TrbK-alt [Brucella intermedia]
MDGKLLARLGAIIFVAVAITATAIEMTREEEIPPAPTSRQLQPTAPDPLRAAQRRCQQLGQKATEDSECLAIWAESRDRFLGIRTQAGPAAPHQNEGQ